MPTIGCSNRWEGPVLVKQPTASASPRVSVNPRTHHALNVSSVVDGHLWDLAEWQGMLFGRREGGLPFMALVFEDADAGRRIVARWRERFGGRDLAERIYVAVVKGVSAAEPSHYTVLITSSVDPSRDEATGGTTAYVGRYLTMTPSTSDNLDAFLRHFRVAGAYELAVAKVDSKTGMPTVAPGVVKRRLPVCGLEDIGPNDPEAMLLGNG